MQSEREKIFLKRLAKASMAFTRNYLVFFIELLLKPNRHGNFREKIEAVMIAALKKDAFTSGLRLQGRKRLSIKNAILLYWTSGHASQWMMFSWIYA